MEIPILRGVGIGVEGAVEPDAREEGEGRYGEGVGDDSSCR